MTRVPDSIAAHQHARTAMLKALALALCFSAPLAHADSCPWMPDSRINAAFPDRAPWSVMAGGQGRCKWVSDESKPSSTISLIQMIEKSPAEAGKYVTTVGGGMAKSGYAVAPLPSIGEAGVAVRENEPDSRMLTLIGHQKNNVVMTQMSFYKGVNAAQQDAAVKLTQETFSADTGGGLVMPK
jgi:hypothetical protein